MVGQHDHQPVDATTISSVGSIGTTWWIPPDPISPADRFSFTRDITGIPDGFAAFLLGISALGELREGAPQAFIGKESRDLRAR